LFFYISVVAFSFGVPFLFAMNYYFMKFKNIWNWIEKMEENSILSSLHHSTALTVKGFPSMLTA